MPDTALHRDIGFRNRSSNPITIPQLETSCNMPTTDRNGRIAIVGVGGIFPGSSSLEEFWRNIVQGIDSGRSVARDRWFLAPDKAVDPDGPKVDRVYSDWTCSVDHGPFDKTGLNLPAEILDRLHEFDPLFSIGLQAARAALIDANQLSSINRDRVSVILGNIALPTEATSAICRDVLGTTLIERLIKSIPELEPRVDELTNRLRKDLCPKSWHPSNQFAASLPAALIAQAFGLGGSAYTLDAACASSLYAIKFACDELRAGRVDAALAGGMSRPDCQYTQMGFAQLKALSRGGRCAPLSADADGLVVGEGAGIFVLKRLDDAVAQGDHIYGVIAGIGLSNDRGANLLAPHSEGQLRAMRAAYVEAGWKPSDIDLIECHATGTPVGDGVEISSLHQLWEDQQYSAGQCVVGGVKSNVGHLLTGAGAAGLMKVLLAIKHQTLPPTANQRNPHPSLQGSSPFRVLSAAQPWTQRNSPNAIPRRATVNAFGFGGINAHLLLEEYQPSTDQHANVEDAPSSKRFSSTEIAVVGFALHSGQQPSAGLQPTSDQTTNRHDWGVGQSNWYQRETKSLGPANQTTFASIDEVRLPFGAFRIPPLEVQDMSPQQQLMLQTAAQALQDAETHSQQPATRSDEAVGNRTGIYIGIELDSNTANFHLRWSIEEKARDWANQLGLELAEHELAAWTNELKDAANPPLTANRVMGNLGGIVASRLAREFQVGGPSFTISSGENSGLRAFDVASMALTLSELDRALVGAVDFPCDIRNRLCLLRQNQTDQASTIADGAVAVVLKRLDDAIRDGDRIHAVIRPDDHSTVNANSSKFENSTTYGAATGLFALGRAIKAVAEHILPQPEPSYWLTNRRDGQRELQVLGLDTDGRKLAFVVSESPVSGQSLERFPVEFPQALFVIDGEDSSEIATGLDLLSRLCDEFPSNEQGLRRSTTSRISQIHRLGAKWFQTRSPQASRSLALTIVAKSVDELHALLPIARQRLVAEAPTASPDRRIQFTRNPLGRAGRLAFVFPGSGNAFIGMGRELLALFPDVLRQQERENQRLKDQYNPDLIWHSSSSSALLEDHKGMIFGQVSLATGICDLLSRFGIQPTASIGYSLGESAALFGLRAWTDRDEMRQRMDDATLFGSDLVRPFDAARRAWNIPNDLAVDWVSGAVDRSADQVRAAIAQHEAVPSSPNTQKVFLLIINTPDQCVIGGQRDDLAQVVKTLHARFVPFAAPSTVHCPILNQVEQSYRDLHLMRTVQPRVHTRTDSDGAEIRQIDFYSTAWGHAYELTRESAADAIVAQAVDTIDFPAVINRAYEDGVRLFVEIGPGSSCTRMIDEILGERPHQAQSVTPITSNPVGAFFDVLGMLITERVPVDFAALYGEPELSEEASVNAREIVTKVSPPAFHIPVPPEGWKCHPERIASEPIPNLVTSLEPESDVAKSMDEVGPIDFVAEPPIETQKNVDSIPSQWTEPAARNGSHKIPPNQLSPVRLPSEPLGNIVIKQLQEMIEARLKAHENFLKVTEEIQRATAKQLELLAQLSSTTSEPVAVAELHAKQPFASEFTSSEPPRSLNRKQCMEFAIGKIGRALGPLFAEIDQHPTRVRLPDEPLMLVDRILEIDGEPLSMTSGRVVTEHDIHSGAWYLDGNRIPTCIAVEAGQADLFLSGWLGIDKITEGLASYRLLDAVVTFHQELPQPGHTIHYDIRINHFFRQGQTYLFRFEFDATVNGEPLLTMREGCAGFFTEAELASGKGIVKTTLDRQIRPGKRPSDWRELAPMTTESYSDAQLLALRQGQLGACFGTNFNGLSLSRPMTLPGLYGTSADAASNCSSSVPPEKTRMWLVDRILKLDPQGGRFGMGLILGELDIHPNDWFLTCHFCDDQVMPGTLMYECCMHTLRVYLLRMGWIGEEGQTAYEPIPGVKSRLKCRGQVRANTQKVWYEITLKELGYSSDGNQTPYCLADALMYADGKPIVEITDMSVRLSGLSRAAVEGLWSSRAAAVSYDRRPAIFDTDRITAFAIGKPSDAFGDRYRVFDQDRVIARLPGPPFQFLDRIVSIKGCEPWVMRAGGEVVAQYDIPSDAWYFQANRQKRMPFSVLLETALQPCGWLAGYVGSALTSETDISFRNLGGSAEQFQDVYADSGTLTTTVRMTAVSQSGGMIIQHYDFDLRCNDQAVYVGKTYFGFFSRESLANQIGIREAKPFAPSEHEVAHSFHLKAIDAAPYPESQFWMVNDIHVGLEGGPHGLGFAVGTTDVDPGSWFFKAHFYQDPVVPGSLGLESFFQLLKCYAVKRWNLGADAQFQMPIVHGQRKRNDSKHEWVYRGQVVPRDRRVTVSAVITQVDDAHRQLTAEGFLSVDGRTIYQMKTFTLGVST